jgi:hypothetical protein
LDASLSFSLGDRRVLLIRRKSQEISIPVGFIPR